MEETYKQRLAEIRQQFAAPAATTDVQKAARSLISTYLKVDAEANSLREKPKPAPSRVPIVSPEEEDFAIAMNLLQQYQSEKKQIQPSPILPKKEVTEYDPRINIEERHQLVNLKREERKATKLQEIPPKLDSSDSRLAELRAKRAALEAEIHPEILQEQRQMVRMEREELQALDLLRRQREQELIQVETVNRHRDRIAKEREQEEREMRVLRRDNFLRVVRGKMEQYIRQNKHWGVRRLAAYWADLKDKEVRLMAKIRFRAASREFNTWVGAVRELKAEREERERILREEMEKSRLEEADKHYKFRVLWEIWKTWLSTAAENKRLREEEREAEKRRRKIAQLFEQMQQRRQAAVPDVTVYAPVETPSLPMEEHQISVPTSEQSVGPETSSLEHSSVQTDFDRVEMTISTPTPTLSITHQVPTPPPDHPSPSLPTNSPLPTPTLPTKKTKTSKQVLAMQQREEERRLKRELLEQKYREKEEQERQKKLAAEQKAIDDEIRRKKEITEKRRLEQQKKKEIEDKKRQEIAKLEEMEAVADSHFRRSVMRYGLLEPWKKAVQRAWKIRQLCIARGEFVSRRLGFRMLAVAVENSKAEKEAVMRGKEEIAERWYEGKLRKMMLDVLRNAQIVYKEELEYHDQWHATRLITRIIHQWHELTPELQTQNDLRKARETAVIRSFQLVCGM